MTLSQTQKDEIVDILINIDDPFYLNTFVDDDDEQEWFHINERRMFLDMQRYLPMIDLNDQENWAFVRRCFYNLNNFLNTLFLFKKTRPK